MSKFRQHQINLDTQIALSAIKQYNFTLPELELIKCLENTTFKLSSKEGKFLLRVYRGKHNTIQDIESEAQIINYLRADSHYKYQEPIRNKADNFVSIGDAKEIYKPVSILSWIDSPPIGDELQDLTLFYKIGKLIAHIHDRLSYWQTPDNLHRPMLDVNSLIGSNGAFKYAPLAYRNLDEETVDLIELVYNYLLEFETLNTRESGIFGIIHGDLHLNNLIIHHNTLVPIDFDDSGWGYYIYDLAVTLAKYWDTPEYSTIKNHL